MLNRQAQHHVSFQRWSYLLSAGFDTIPQCLYSAWCLFAYQRPKGVCTARYLNYNNIKTVQSFTWCLQHVTKINILYKFFIFHSLLELFNKNIFAIYMFFVLSYIASENYMTSACGLLSISCKELSDAVFGDSCLLLIHSLVLYTLSRISDCRLSARTFTVLCN